MAGSIFSQRYLQEMLALRLEATFGQIKGDDKVLRKVKASTFGRYERNLSFGGNITEFMLAAEIHPLYIFNRYDEDKVLHGHPLPSWAALILLIQATSPIQWSLG